MPAATLLAPALDEADTAPFETAPCHAMLRHYLAARGARRLLPHAELDPARLAPLLPNLLIFELSSAELFRVRLAGTAFRYWFGRDLTGQNWLDVSHPLDRAARQRRVPVAALQPCGLRSRTWQFRDGLPRRQFEALTLPLAPRQPEGPPVMLLALGEAGRDDEALSTPLDLEAMRRVDWSFVDLGHGVPLDDGL